MDLYIAIKIDGETDAIAFDAYSDCVRFCNLHPEYNMIETALYTLSTALDLFGE